MLKRPTKEAIKVALSLVIAYGIAMSQDWYKPAWAGFTVTIIAIPMYSIEQSLKKSGLRLMGTVPGSILGLIMIVIAPQNRFLFIAIIMIIMFFCTYMMLIDKKRNYVWNVIGFTMLIISSVGVGGGASSAVFNNAMFRILETLTGILVYSAVSFLVWPNKKEHSSQEALVDVLTIFSSIFNYQTGSLQSKDILLSNYKRIAQLSDKIKYFEKEIEEDIFEEVIQKKNKEEWKTLVTLFEKMSFAVMNINILRKDIYQNNDTLVEEDIQYLFTLIKGKVDRIISYYKEGIIPPKSISAINLSAHQNKLSDLDKQYLKGINYEFHHLQSLLDDIRDCIRNIKDPSHSKKAIKIAKEPYFKWNRFALRKSFYVALSTLSGFLLWIYFDPPGHHQWYVMVGLNTMMIANMPTSKPRNYLPPVYIMIVGISIIYCFILPQLDGFIGLAIVLFIYTYCQHRYMKGRAYITASIGLMAIGISIHQTYDFEKLVNGFVFDVMYMMWLIVTGYLIDITRLEKKYLNYLRQFFKSAHYLFEKSATSQNSIRKRIAIEDIKVIPNHLKNLQKSIDYAYYDKVNKDQLEELTVLVFRISYRLHLILEQEVDEQNSKADRQVIALIKNVNTQLLDLSLGKNYDIDKIKKSISEIYEEREKGQATSSFDFINSFNTFYQALHSYYLLKKTIPLSQLEEEKFS